MTGAQAVLKFLSINGVEYVFGNPGSTEIPLLREFAGTDTPQFVLSLHENSAAAMADGYAAASGKLGVVLAHCTGGIANTLALIYNAMRSETPLLVLVGQQSTQIALQDPFLYSDMDKWLSPMFRWTCQVATASDIPRALRRAVLTSMESPRGPVCVLLPMDVLESECNFARTEFSVSLPLGLPLAPAADIERLDECLRNADNPVVIAGDRVAHFGAQESLREFIDTSGLPVFLESYPTRSIFPLNHPNCRGILGKMPSEVHAALSEFDAVLVVGARAFEVFMDDGSPILPADTPLLHVDAYPSAIGRNHPIAAGAAGDLNASLRKLTESLKRTTGRAHPSQFSAEPSRHDLAQALRASFRAGDILVEEAISNRLAVIDGALRNEAGTWYGEKGGTIGWGPGAAVGVSMANPDKRVIAVIGDGSFVLANHAMWSARQLKCSITYVVLVNEGYQILRDGVENRYQMKLDERFAPLNIPGVHWQSLVEAFGLPYFQTDVRGLPALLGGCRERGESYVVAVDMHR